MSAIETIPSMAQLQNLADMTPEYMRPNMMPSAVVLKSHLTPYQCDEIVATCGGIPTHNFHGCNAQTRDCDRPLSDCLLPIHGALRFANDLFFGFDVDPHEPAAWMQTYDSTQDYKSHTDGSPGQSRKLTAVAMLSDQRDYGGGHLVLEVAQKHISVPSNRGTIIVFPAWVSHYVTPIDYGRRQTINMGLWGPPFK